ncbi:hypothetical protein D3C76_1520200 [compost metagenome]
MYSREILAMNLAGQLARLPADQGLEKVASNKTARLLKLGLPELNRLRKVDNVPAKPQEATMTAIEPAPEAQADQPAAPESDQL